MADAQVTIGADASAFTRAINDIRRNTETMANSITARLARFGQAFQGLGAIGSSIKGAAGALGELGSALVKPAAQMERLELSFEVALGSKTAALDFIQQLNDYAAKTPFVLDEITSAAQKLIMNAGLSQDETMKVIGQIGDIAAMTGARMEDLAQIYAKAANIGFTNEIAEQFETAGFAVRKYIAEIQGIPFAEVFEKTSKGEMSIEHLQAAMEKATGAGGAFSGATARLSQTFEGLTSTLQDNITGALRDFGREILPALKPALEKLIELVQQASPAFAELGAMVGEMLGSAIEDKFIPSIDEMILMIPDVLAWFEEMRDTIQDVVDTVLAIPNAFGAVYDAVDHFSKRISGMVVYDMSWSSAGAWASRVQARESDEEKRNRRRLVRQQNLEDMMQRSAERAAQRRRAAEAEDEAMEAERARASEDAARRDAAARTKLAADEAEKKRLAAQKKLLEDNKRAYEDYQRAREEYYARVRDEAREALSLQERESALREDARSAGLKTLSGDAIRARMDALAEAGAAEHAKEIEQLQRLLEGWQQLRQAKAEYSEQRAETLGNLRVTSLEALGRTREAEQLRRQEAERKRISELVSQGFSDTEAQKTAALEQRIARLNALQKQQGGVEFIQNSLASVGGGGVSIRLTSMQDIGRETNKILKDIKKLSRDLLNKKSSNVAILA